MSKQVQTLLKRSHTRSKDNQNISDSTAMLHAVSVCSWVLGRNSNLCFQAFLNLSASGQVELSRGVEELHAGGPVLANGWKGHPLTPHLRSNPNRKTCRWRPQIGLLRLSKKQQVNNVRTPTRRKTLFNLSRHPHVIILAGKTPQFYRSSPNSTMVGS